MSTTVFRPGDIVINESASEANPRRVGIIRDVRIRFGKQNPGAYYELTDYSNGVWEINVRGSRLQKIGYFDLVSGPKKAVDDAKATVEPVKCAF